MRGIFLFRAIPIAYLINFIWDIYWKHKKPVKINSKVISIGNIAVGGSGKTTLAGFVARSLLDQGYKVALVARGYGRLSKSSATLCGNSDISWESVGDEPAALARSIPGLTIYVDSNKTKAARQAAEGGFQYIIIDDGFQHRNLYRDIDIVCIEGKKPFGNGFLLPAGPLREPPRSIKRADILVAFGPDEEKAVLREVSGKPLFNARKVVSGIKDLNGQSVDLIGKRLVAFCGLGNPNSFRESLSEIKCDIAEFMTYRDHKRYQARDIKNIAARVNNTNSYGAITSLKDLVKLKGIWPINTPLYYLEISIELDNRPEFLKLLTK